MSTTRVQRLLTEYGSSHQNPTNKAIHWVMVPLIYLSLVALLWGISIASINAALMLSIPAMIYYLMLSLRLGAGMLLFNITCLTLCWLAEIYIPIALWKIAVGLFIPAWIFQFIGHNIEGRKPSFFRDIQFLLIGPMWLMSALYRRLGVDV